jgi:hypothetical protein
VEGERIMRKKAIFSVILIAINVTLITIIVIGIMKIPQAIYWKQDKDILDNIQTVEIESNWVGFRGTQSSMNINEKVQMLEQKDDNILKVTLETGNMYSLYEARKRTFDEMSKIPIIEMDVYGPVKDEIKIEPILYINGKAPSKTMIVWSGTVLVNKITYSVMLEEESGKILAIKGDGLDKSLHDALQQEWREYLHDDVSERIIL